MQAVLTRTSFLKRAARFASEVACETLWPTRCALCDRPGEVLCSACRDALPFIDGAKSCPRCGAAFGLRQCDFCNSLALGRLGRAHPPFDGCASVTAYGEETGTLVRSFKDGGEQRLGAELACLMAHYVAPAWRISALTYVPASQAAYRNRGFDHAAILARALAQELEVPLVSLFERPHSRDQRKLGAQGRMANLQGRLRLRKEVVQRACEEGAREERASSLPESAGQCLSAGEAHRTLEGGVLVVDDVFTTGATLCAACDALSPIAPHIYCLTFARG